MINPSIAIMIFLVGTYVSGVVICAVMYGVPLAEAHNIYLTHVKLFLRL